MARADRRKNNQGEFGGIFIVGVIRNPPKLQIAGKKSKLNSAKKFENDEAFASRIFNACPEHIALPDSKGLKSREEGL